MDDTSDEDELGNDYKENESTRVTRAENSRRVVSRDDTRVAGPSRQPANGHGRKRKAKSPTVDIEEDGQVNQENQDTDEGEEVVELAPPVTTKGKGKAHGASKAATRSQTTVRKDGASVKKAKTVETEVDESDGAILRDKARLNDAKAVAAKKQSIEEKKMRIQLDRLQNDLKQITTHRDAFIAQLEEAFTLRKTEPEEALEQQAAQYEARIRTQDEMINELTSQLARVDSLTKAGKTSTLHFLTREAADEERRVIEKKVQSLTQTIANKDKIISERDSKILEQEQIIRILRSDLKAEIDNTKVITSRNLYRDPPSSASKGPRAPVTSTDELKNGKVIRLYEDFTNLLVINVKYQESGEFGEEETMYKCLFTHEASKRSLNFSLRIYKGFIDSSNPDSEMQGGQVIYTPLELDKEPDQEFVAKLDHLAQSFTFSADQLNVFLNSLNETMTNTMQEDEDMEHSDV